MKLSIVIPARDEEGSIASTLQPLTAALSAARIDHEILVVDDRSSDRTAAIVNEVAVRDPRVRYIANLDKRGFGHAVRAGLDAFTGDAVSLVMADGSDNPDDIVEYCRLLEQGYDCAFGSRFAPGGSAAGYPPVKLVINRLVNLGLRLMFHHGYDDTTNACKAYRREVIENVAPLRSSHFDLTVELPLKAVVRGFTYAIVPIQWTSRTRGDSKLRLTRMAGRYVFTILSVFLADMLSRGSGAGRRRSPLAGRGRSALRRRR